MSLQFQGYHAPSEGLIVWEEHLDHSRCGAYIMEEVLYYVKWYQKEGRSREE